MVFLEEFRNRAQVARTEVDDLRTELRAREETYQQVIENLREELGQTKGELKAVKAERERWPGWLKWLAGEYRTHFRQFSGSFARSFCAILFLARPWRFGAAYTTRCGIRGIGASHPYLHRFASTVHLCVSASDRRIASDRFSA